VGDDWLGWIGCSEARDRERCEASSSSLMLSKGRVFCCGVSRYESDACDLISAGYFFINFNTTLSSVLYRPGITTFASSLDLSRLQDPNQEFKDKGLTLF